MRNLQFWYLRRCSGLNCSFVDRIKADFISSFISRGYEYSSPHTAHELPYSFHYCVWFDATMRFTRIEGMTSVFPNILPHVLRLNCRSQERTHQSRFIILCAQWRPRRDHITSGHARHVMVGCRPRIDKPGAWGIHTSSSSVGCRRTVQWYRGSHIMPRNLWLKPGIFCRSIPILPRTSLPRCIGGGWKSAVSASR